MRWIAKAAVQKGLSAVPGGERLNYQLQRRVTKRLPVRDELFLLRVRAAGRHVRLFDKHGRVPLGEARAYEFGAGWELIGPLAMWMLGIERQHLIDIRPHVRLEIVNGSLERFARLHDDVERIAQRPARPMPT